MTPSKKDSGTFLGKLMNFKVSIMLKFWRKLRKEKNDRELMSHHL